MAINILLKLSIFHFVHHELNRPWNFFNDIVFHDARMSLNAVMKIRRSECVGIVKKQAGEITLEMEEKLWTTKMFGSGSVITVSID